MREGLVIRGYSGFYYIQSDNELYECSLRGRLKLVKGLSILPGDLVEISIIGPGKGVLEEVLPRRTELVRPPIANVDQVIIVMAAENPPPNFQLLDRLLIFAEHSHLQAVIVINKIDLVSETERDNLRNIYAKTGYPLMFTCAKKKEGIEQLKEVLQNRITVFAGNSGVGKSSLLNVLQEGLALKTGQVSDKNRRGRHTTRHVELLPLDFGGWVADTPGFSTLNLPQMKREELGFFFPEIERNLGNCRFTSCLHNQEPNCGVKAALDAGEIHPQRYHQYLTFLEEVVANERRY